MKFDSLPHYLRSHRMDDLVVEFEDGDQYPVAALDLWGGNPDGDYEISVRLRTASAAPRRRPEPWRLDRWSLASGNLVDQRDAEEASSACCTRRCR